MRKIKCQACKKDDTGCWRCGGFKIIAEESLACGFCKKKAFFKPGSHTVYEGKEYTSFDGLDVVYSAAGPYCKTCYNQYNLIPECGAI